MLEYSLENITSRCEVGSYIYVVNQLVEVISSSKLALLAMVALNRGLVFQLRETAQLEPYLVELTNEAGGGEV